MHTKVKGAQLVLGALDKVFVSKMVKENLEQTIESDSNVIIISAEKKTSEPIYSLAAN